MGADLDIGEVAARSGVAPSALRFYEREGLLEPNGRNGLRRTYAPEVLHRLALIVTARDGGFTVKEVGALLDADDEHALRSRLAAKADELDRRITELATMRDRLQHAARCEAPSLLGCPTFGAGLAAALPHRSRRRA